MIAPLLSLLKIIFSHAFVTGFVRVVLGSIGIGIVSYVGIDHLVDFVASEVRSRFSGGIGSDLAGLAGLTNIDYGINILFAGVSVRVTMMTLKRLKVI